MIDRRDFLRMIGVAGAGATLLGSSAILTSCSKKSESEKTSTSLNASGEFAAVRISSDLHNSELRQRIAFSVFDSKRKIAAQKSTSAILKSPTNKEQVFKNIALREKGIEGRGIYSIDAILNETGTWEIKTKHESQPLEFSIAVAEKNIAPFMDDACPTADTPTNSSPLDAKILCTRFDGECGLHKKNVPQLLQSNKPFVVLFATPARCQTNYCGPVVDLALAAKKKFDVEIVHVEIYKDDVSNDVLDAVTAWNLPSEPWMFGVTASGKISNRLDGAFDQSEIEDLIKNLS